MLALKTMVASAVLMAAPAFAAPLLLDFESAPLSPVQVLKSYQAQGITFDNNAWAAASAAFGGLGNFYGPGGTDANRGAVYLTSNPLPAGGVVPSGPLSFTINIANGFDNSFSLRYAGEAGTTITAYDIDGVEVATASGSGTAICGGNFACNWNTLSLNLGATDVFSVVVSGTDSKDWYDNINFGNLLPATPGNDVPEPSGVALSLAALGALAWSRKRTRS